jgi:prepilin-type N-terminal cleavage/methylation domain-containing protein
MWRRARARPDAFTLLEVLLTIALIALLATVLIGGSARMVSEQPVSPYEVFTKAVQDARKAALQREHEMRLKFDKEKKRFVILDGLAPTQLAADGFTKEEVPVKVLPLTPGTEEFTIDFLGAGKGGPVIMIAGVVVETQPISYVTFYSDGTCSAFRVQFTRRDASNIVSIDPWTCAPMLTATSEGLAR